MTYRTKDYWHSVLFVFQNVAQVVLKLQDVLHHVLRVF